MWRSFCHSSRTPGCITSNLVNHVKCNVRRPLLHYGSISVPLFGHVIPRYVYRGLSTSTPSTEPTTSQTPSTPPSPTNPAFTNPSQSSASGSSSQGSIPAPSSSDTHSTIPPHVDPHVHSSHIPPLHHVTTSFQQYATETTMAVKRMLEANVYRSITILGGVIVLILTGVYLFRDPLKQKTVDEMADVAKRSLGDQQVQTQVSELSQEVLHNLLHDPHILASATSFVHNIIQQESTQKAMLELAGMVSNRLLRDPTTLQLTTELAKQTTHQLMADAETHTALAKMFKDALLLPENQDVLMQLLATVIHDPSTKQLSTALANDIIHDLLNDEEIQQHAKHTFKLVVGESLWPAVKASMWGKKEAPVSPRYEYIPALSPTGSTTTTTTSTITTPTNITPTTTTTIVTEPIIPPPLVIPASTEPDIVVPEDILFVPVPVEIKTPTTSTTSSPTTTSTIHIPTISLPQSSEGQAETLVLVPMMEDIPQLDIIPIPISLSTSSTSTSTSPSMAASIPTSPSSSPSTSTSPSPSRTPKPALSSSSPSSALRSSSAISHSLSPYATTPHKDET